MVANADVLVRSTVRIEGMLDGRVTQYGSGVLMAYYVGEGQSSFMLIVVTNKHVVKGADQVRYTIQSKQDRIPIRSHVPAGSIVHHPNPDIDLCVLPVPDALAKAEFHNAAFISSRDIYSVEQLADLTAIENVIMIGYPNGLIDQSNLYPIARKGITATPAFADHNGAPEFMIDCACFPGSSGSPVFILDQGYYTDKNNDFQFGKTRFGLLGFMYAGPVLNQIGKVVAQAPPDDLADMVEVPLMMNLGYVVKANQLHEMVRDLLKVAVQLD